MSGDGAPEIQHTDGTGLAVTIVAGQWHEQIASGLLEGAIRALTASGVTINVVRVPGSFELPVVAKAVLEGGADAVVALGVIIRGGTPHFEYVGCRDQRPHAGEHPDRQPVGFGLLTLDDEQQDSTGPGCPAQRKTREPRPPRPLWQPRCCCDRFAARS